MRHQETPSACVRCAVSVAVLLAACAASARAEAPALTGDFGSPKSLGMWNTVSGKWVMKDNAFIQEDARRWDYRYACLKKARPFTLFTFEATPLEVQKKGDHSFGVVLNYVDKSNWVVFRFGSYGVKSLLSRVNGAKRVQKIDVFRPSGGVTYKVAVAWKGDRLFVFLNGALQCSRPRLFPKAPLRPGLFTECKCRFTDLKAWTTWWPAQRFIANITQRCNADRKGFAERLKRGVFSDDFSSPDMTMWRRLPIRMGRIADSQFQFRYRSQRTAYALAPVYLINGAIEGIATATAAPQRRTCGFGVMVKRLDAANWVAVRYGYPNAVTKLTCVANERSAERIGRCPIEVGRKYRFKVVVKGGNMQVYCDDKKVGGSAVPFAGLAGRPGMFAQSPAAYDEFNVTGATRAVRKPSRPIKGTPKLTLEHVNFRPALATKGAYDTGKGSLYLYVRNTGSGAAELKRVLVDGLDADDLTNFGDVLGYRMRPFRLAPGEAGEVLISIGALPSKLRMAPEGAAALLPVTIEAFGAEPLKIEAPVKPADDFQINFVGFSAGLDKVYVYVQRNPGVRRTFRLTRVSVNGRDMTASARFGEKTLARDIVPVVIHMPKPFREGVGTLATVRAAGGQRADLAVRALPGVFQIQVTLVGRQSRPDRYEDIRRHNFTCVGFCARNEAKRLSDAIKLGLGSFPYAWGLDGMLRHDKPGYPKMSGMWLDEIDRYPTRQTFEMIQECDDHLRKQGRFAPLQMANIVASTGLRAAQIYEAADAASGAYGYHGGSLGVGFGRVASMPKRSYRMSRRMFMPYLRDAETAVPIDKKTREVVKLDPNDKSQRYRVIEPREERWLTFGCLVQGAKSVLHWPYSSGFRLPHTWFDMKTPYLRCGMGGALGHDPWGYKLPEKVKQDLKAVWDEIGRINIELQAVGPLVAVSDVTTRAKVTAARPAKNPAGEPSVEAAALISGLDSIVLVVLNQNIKTNWNMRAKRGIVSYDPVDATVSVRLPKWLKPKHVFRVRHNGVAEVTREIKGGDMVLRFPRLDVSELVVITERDGLMQSTARIINRLNPLPRPK